MERFLQQLFYRLLRDEMTDAELREHIRQCCGSEAVFSNPAIAQISARLVDLAVHTATANLQPRIGEGVSSRP